MCTYLELSAVEFYLLHYSTAPRTISLSSHWHASTSSKYSHSIQACVIYIFTFLLQICFCHSGHGCVTFTCYPFVYHSGACFCQGLTTLYLNTLILTSSVRICDIGQQYPFDFSVIYYMSYTPDSFNKSSYVCQCRCKKIAVSFLTFKLENCSNPTFSGILCSFIYNSCLNILTFVLENCHTFQKLANYLV